MRLLLPWFAIASVLALAACDDDLFGPSAWTPEPDTVIIYSASRPELQGRPSGFDFARCPAPFCLPVVVETLGASNNWDVLLEEKDGAFLLKPPGAFSGVSSTAGIAEEEAAEFEDIERAPADAERYNRTEAVPIRLDRFYIIRTRAISDFFFGNCVYYAKLQPIELDPEAGTFRFAYVSNPNCNYRELAGQS